MKIKIDEAAYTAAGLEYRRDSATHATLTFPDDITHHGAPLSVGVQIDGDELWLFPERSAGQRKLLAALGKPQPEPVMPPPAIQMTPEEAADYIARQAEQEGDEY